MAASAKSTPPRGLTEAKLAELAGGVHKRRFEIRDRQCPGLFARVGTSGAITFRVHMYDKAAGKHRNETVGRWPELRLDDARARLKKMRAAHKAGAIDRFLAGDKKTVAELGELFLGHLAKRRRNPDDPRSSVTIARSYFERYVFPKIGGIAITMVSSGQCREIIEGLVTAEKPGAASMVHQLLGQFFKWCEGQDLVERNPARALDRVALGAVASAPRKRRLDVDEIGTFWRAMEDETTPGTRTSRLALKVLLLTAARQGELVKARWADVDFEKGTWTIPPENRKMKKGQEHDARDFVVPLPTLALAVLRELHELAGKSPWVLPSPMHGGAAHFSVLTLSTACRNFFVVIRGKPAALAMPPWTPHDLRRTARSCFTEKLGAEPLIAERCLGHSVGGRVFLTYDTGDYLEQRRALLDNWAVYVEQLARPTAAPVAFLHAKARPS